jgi:hypothetical protein
MADPIEIFVLLVSKISTIVPIEVLTTILAGIGMIGIWRSRRHANKNKNDMFSENGEYSLSMERRLEHWRLNPSSKVPPQ